MHAEAPAPAQGHSEDAADAYRGDACAACETSMGIMVRQEICHAHGISCMGLCCETFLLSVRRSDGLSSVNREATGTANSLRKRVAFGDRTIPSIHVYTHP